MNAPAQVTEAHRQLVRLISWAGISGKQVEEKAQLVADSEARALSVVCGRHVALIAERDQLRAEVERLKNLLLQADELNEGALFNSGPRLQVSENDLRNCAAKVQQEVAQ